MLKRILIARGKKLPRRKKRFPRQVFPTGIQRAYYRRIMLYYEAVKRQVLQELIPRLEGLRAGQPAPVRTDSWADDLDAIVKRIRANIARETTEAELDALALKTGRDVTEWQARQLKDGLKRVVELDVFFEDAGLAEKLTGWAYDNTRLITKLGDDVLNEVEGVVSRGIQSGETRGTIRDQILGTDIDAGVFASREYRAELIARDQVGKLYGEVAQARQTELGIDSYIWRTARDERVRDRHADREGKIFKWSDPPEGGHPGEDYQCRCYAEPVIPALED